MVGEIRVFAPMQTVAEVDGVSVLLLTVEILDDFTALRFYCPRSARTVALDDGHEQEMQAYIERHRQGGWTAPPPSSPMEVLFGIDRFPSIVLDDGCDTEFQFRSGQLGQHREWLLDATFRGTPSPAAAAVTVSLSLPVGTTTPARVALDTQHGAPLPKG